MELIGVLIGGSLVLLGQGLAHRFTVQRDRRAELGDRIDRTVAAYVDADRALGRLILHVKVGSEYDAIQAQANKVEDLEVEMRAAQFSVGLRSTSSSWECSGGAGQLHSGLRHVGRCDHGVGAW